jgi:signal recognition particle subunit SRP54
MFDFLTNQFSALLNTLQGKKSISERDIEATVETIENALLQADIPYHLVQDFIAGIKKEVVGSRIVHTLKPAEQIAKVVHDQLMRFLAGPDSTDSFTFVFPSVVMVMGLQGSGKTTSIAKIARFIEKAHPQKKPKILLASVDFYRPAAIDQLAILAKQVACPFYRATAQEVVLAAQEIYNYFQAQQYDLLLLDTAGRLHVDNALLKELRDIEARVHPRYKFLVLDAMTGQESLTVARGFEQAVGFTHALMSKMDSDTRGGAAFSFRYALQKPIQFIGTGEKIEHLEVFYPERMVGRILGKGDLVSLAEKANEKVKQSEQEAAYQAFMKGNFTLQDFLKQMDMMSRIGSLSSILSYFPGAQNSMLSPEKLEQGEREMKKFKAIINSMTVKERLQPGILDNARKKRVAAGAGVAVSEVNNLLQRFEQSKQYVKLLKKFGLFNNVFK